jgi:hypothetical protein
MLRLGVVVTALMLAHSARAEWAPITDRNYAIDLYDGVAIGNTDMIGMGGAGTAVVLGTAGVLLNPSAIAVRPTTDRSPWSLDYHLDVLSSKYSSDYDNNGRVASGGALLVTAGIGGRYHDWGIAVTGTAQVAPVSGSPQELRAQVLRVRFAVARWLPRFDLAVGGGVQSASFRLDSDEGVTQFSISGLGAIAGATWLPHGESFRIGVGLDGPIDGGSVEVDACKPPGCNIDVLPAHVRAPWRVAAGGAMRWAATPWNQTVATPYRDEQSLVVAADVVVTGATSRGYGLEAFGTQELQRSGRHAVLGLRVGASGELLPGRLRVRAGSYWEPGRFDDVSGRLHGTFGVDLRMLAFHLWGPRRGRISITTDVASRYRNAALSIGLWH